MKQYIVLSLAIIMAALTVNAQNYKTSPALSDSVANEVKLKALNTKKGELENKIKVEDAKRNRQVAGVTPETIEAMNDRQDSICLALRSQLVEVNREIRELTPDNTSQVLIQQFNNLVTQPAQAAADGNTPTANSNTAPTSSQNNPANNAAVGQSQNNTGNQPAAKPTKKPTKKPAKKPVKKS